MVYVDPLVDYSERMSLPPRMRRKWCHLTADTELELRQFGRRLGLNAAWIQYPGTWKVHFDLVESMRAKAVRLGAIEETRREHATRRHREAHDAPQAVKEHAL